MKYRDPEPYPDGWNNENGTFDNGFLSTLLTVLALCSPALLAVAIQWVLS